MVKGPLPLPARRAMRKVGQDIKDARLRRRITAALLAERANISPRTLSKIERGDSTVAIGSYAAVLFSLRMIDRFADIADARHDRTGIELMQEQLPKRVRIPKKEDGEIQ